MSNWVAVHGLADGEKNEGSVLNRPIFELVERTNYLKQQITSLTDSGLYESMRILDAPLATGTAAPVVGDIVYLDPITQLYGKALSGVAAADVFSASASSYAVGLLVSIVSGLGTIVSFGRQELATSGSGWALSSLLESGEAFRNGAYYLSTLEAGKLTANPSGPSIYVGQFLEDVANPGYGGFALLDPQYKDLAQSHVHRAYPLFAQPAGSHYFTGTTPADIHEIRGFNATTLSGVPTDHQPRLVITGTWTGLVDTQYTIWLSSSSLVDTTPAASQPPTSFAHYLHWTSSDAAEGSGVTRVWSFEVPVAVGTKGLMASLENNLAGTWGTPYAVVGDTAGTPLPDYRTWTIDAPTQTRGWLANKMRQNFVPSSTKDFSIVLMGGPHTSTDARAYDTLTVKAGKFYEIVYVANPTDGNTITIDSTVYEFDNNGVVTGSNIPVSIGATDDASYGNLVDAIVNAGISGIDVVLNETDGQLVVSVSVGSTVTVSGLPAPSLLTTGLGNLETTGVAFIAYDQNHRSLLLTPTYAGGVLYYAPQALLNGLSFMAVPYSSTGVAAASPGTVSANDYWTAAIVDAANGTPFRYAMGMHSGLAQYYPPVPMQDSALILNGVEVESYDLFPNTPTYRLGLSTIYWFTDAYGTVPWPRDWVDVNNVGSAVYAANSVLHFVKMTIGNSGIVTSIRPAAGSPIKVTQCGTTTDATTGDLELSLDLGLSSDSANLAGYKVVKAIDGQKLKLGPVVEQITSDGTITINQTPGAASGQGIVSLSVANASYGGDFEEVALQNAKQELIGMFPYIRLNGWTTGALNNVPTAFVAKFRVDHTLDASKKFKVIVYMTVFGESDIPWALVSAGGTVKYAGIEFSYSILPDFVPYNQAPDWPAGAAWNALNTTLPQGLITTTSPILAEIPFGLQNDLVPTVPIYSAYDPMLIHNNTSEVGGTDISRKIAKILGDPFPVQAQVGTVDDPMVRAGSLVGIKVARASLTSGSPEYTGNIGFINLRWKLVSV